MLDSSNQEIIVSYKKSFISEPLYQLISHSYIVRMAAKRKSLSDHAPAYEYATLAICSLDYLMT